MLEYIGMKKKIISIFLGMFLLISVPKDVVATCGSLNARGICNPGQTNCGGGLCCTTQQECPTPAPTSTPSTSCVPYGNGCNISQTACSIDFFTKYCCGSANDCTDLKNGRSGGGVTNPTCGSGGVGTEINTAIGCVPFHDTGTFVGTIFKWALGIGGGVAFLLIVFSGFLIMTSTGNPERLQQGKELMTSAISGLILLIFSVFVLRFLGINILGLPGFGQSTTPSVIHSQ